MDMFSRCCVTHVWICFMLVAHVDQSRSVTVWDLIQENNMLRELQQIIVVNGLSSLFEENGITVFAPYSSAFLYFNDLHYGYNMANPKMVESLLSYHIAQGIIYESDVVDNRATDSLHPSGSRLHFNTFVDGDEMLHSVNGAVLIHVDIVASNGVLHIIDKVIAPIASNKTLHDFMLYPDIPDLSFVAISRASIIDMTLKNRTRNNNYQFTAFAPNDSVLFPMPSYAQDILFGDPVLLKLVIQAHMIPDYIQFLPSSGELLPQTTTAGTDISFERRNGELYVKNKKVRARVVDANIPVSNGVIHVIDNLLYYVYMDISQQLQKMMETKKAFGYYLNQLPINIRTQLSSADSVFTVFAPTDDAFGKIPIHEQENLANETSRLLEVLTTHIVPDVEIVGYQIAKYSPMTTLSNKTITVFEIGDDVYVEAGGVQAKVILKDIKCTNGIIHLISNVLLVRDFSIWDAISGNDQMQYTADMISKHDPDFQAILSGTNPQYGQLTMFVPGDDVGIDKFPERTLNYLKNDPSIMLGALKGHVVRGEIPSYDVTSMVVKETISGREIILENRKGFSVTGSHIFAKVVIRDILCSNGIIHIIDDLMHVPTRNILEQMARYTDLDIVTSFFSMSYVVSLRSKLRTEDVFFTVFVPVDDSFDDVPRTRTDEMLDDEPYMEKILKAHVVPNVSLYAEDFLDGDMLLAEEEFIHIVRENNSDVAIINNNVKAKILKSNIRATNGQIHVIDRLLYFPYRTVAETMTSDSRFSAFYDLISTIEDFQNMAGQADEQMTVFVPSVTFLESISYNQSNAIKASPEILQQIFMGHVIPGIRLDSMYLRQHFIQQLKVNTSYNTTFEFERRDQEPDTVVSTEYPNLRRSLDVVRNGVACSNGILYTIDGFLSWSLLNIMEELRADKTIHNTSLRFLGLLLDGMDEEFEDEEKKYTIFIPEESAMSHVQTELNDTEKLQLYANHVINGSVLTLNDLIDAGNSTSDQNGTVRFIVRNKEVYLSWEEKEAKIIKSNILANNGIIHLVDNLLLTLPEPEVTTKKGALEPGVGLAVVTKVNYISIYISCLFGFIIVDAFR